MILDTSFVIDLMNNHPEAVLKARELQQKGEHTYICTPTLFELWSGLAQSNKPVKEKQKIMEIISSQLVLNFDKESAEEAGKIDGLLKCEGQMIDPEDSMIAGIAKRHGECVLTKNVKHFSRIKTISCATY
ncbi:TPA: type II toxin-antitoxin system VapC family toxin [Candidatus Woesearchaeota archaeon]|nr:type II toxin-antitoxin system VapC family toxin [Candidatus Woesearchaeota archaeon]